MRLQAVGVPDAAHAFSPSTNTLTQASNGSLYNRTLVHTPTTNFAPRFGFSDSINPETVLRGGYGIVYVQFNRAGGENNLTYNGPNVVNATVNNNNSVYPTPASLCANDTQVQTLCFRQTQQGYSNILTSPAYSILSTSPPATSIPTSKPATCRASS
jgi:hypothetical protein